MTDIYQAIWNADQTGSGLHAIRSSEAGDPAHGYVKVSEHIGSSADPDLRVLEEVVIPPSKRRTYKLCEKLFNNFALPERAREVDTPEERTERHAFVEAVRDSPPMRIAQAYIAERTGEEITPDRWHNTLMDLWFRRFSQGGDPDLSGFEHVVVGEQEGGKVQGYHFWYKYYLDDGFARTVDDGRSLIPGLSDDRIAYVRSKASEGQDDFPESVTIQYRWDAIDYDAQAVRPLFKKIGGFFVGCSVEGLMALGTVRAHLGAKAPKTAVIEGARYDMKVYRSENGRHIRTLYPIFLGAADPVTGVDRPLRPPPTTRRPVEPGSQGDVRIVAALVNPDGDDPGRETVTIVHAGPKPIDLSGWSVVDRNGKAEAIDPVTLHPGKPHTITLGGDGAQLSNRGGSIALMRDGGEIVHSVEYSRSQARRANQTILF